MAQGVQRWMEVTPSQFTHEAEGLALVRALHRAAEVHLG